ncbi:MAG: helix-turn-helix domain-containing protein [Thermoleophilia bacterium]
MTAAAPARPVARAHGALPGGGWEMWRAAADPRLAGLADALTGFREHGAPASRSETPSGRIPVIVTLEGAWRVAGPEGTADVGTFTAGLWDVPATVTGRGPTECLQIDLTPPAARRVLGIPLGELRNRAAGAADLPGCGLAELTERIGWARTWQERFALADAWLLDRLARTGDGGAVDRAWDAIAAAGGSARVGPLATDLGVPRTHLATRFRREFGLSPREAGRVLRLERAVAALRADPAADLARLATACGWYDQPHMHRDVRRLTGRTPAQLRAAVMPGAGGIAA